MGADRLVEHRSCGERRSQLAHVMEMRTSLRVRADACLASRIG